MKLSEEIRVMHAHNGTGEPLKTSASTHTVEECVLAEHRDTASSNANKFNLATDEENIDFNIPGVPNSMVKRSHGVNVHNLIQKIENHPQRRALQSDLQQYRQFNPFSRESQDAIKAAGNTELCEIVDVEPKAQCRACLTYWEVGIVYSTCGHFLRDDTTENKKYIKSVLGLFSIPNFYIRKGQPHGHRYGKKESDKEYHTANQLQKKCVKRKYKNIHARGHSTKRTDGIFHRPCMRRTTTHHDAAQLSTARVGALRPMPYCLGIGSTRVGPGRTPTVHPC